MKHTEHHDIARQYGRTPLPDVRWLPNPQPAWVRYGAATVLTLLAVWLRLELAPADSGGRFVTVSLAVALSALFCGPGPGVLSAVLGTVLVNFFLFSLPGTLAIKNPTEAFWLNAWHLVTQAVVIGAIWVMQAQNRRLSGAIRDVRAHQQRFLDTFEHAASGITHVDTQGRLLRANQTFCQMVGYSHTELGQMRFADITHPDDVGADLSLMDDALAGKRTSYTLEKRYRHKDGHIVWAQLTVALVRKTDGEPDYFISVAQDLNAQKATEEELRTSKNLLDQAQLLANMGAWWADMATGRIARLPGSSGFLAFPKAEYDLTTLLDYIHPDDRAMVQQRWTQGVKGIAPYVAEYRVLIDGREYWHTVKAEFERDADGRALRALGITQDVTERKRIELEVQRLNASLEQRIQERTRALKDAYAELESYSYAVAHDLRSPLRIINGFAQALQEDHPGLGQSGHDHLSRIKAASKKMGQLIDGLLQVSQYARGDVQRVPVNLTDMALRQLEELAATDPNRRVDWVVEPGLQVLADASLIEAVMQNLLHNAWKYTADTPNPRIRVYAVTDGQVRRYCVSDNGAGFNMARADKLFQPFQRLHQPHEFAGLGIGLATARRIVQRHGGDMTAESTPGQGATFCFTLPPATDGPARDTPHSG